MVLILATCTGLSGRGSTGNSKKTEMPAGQPGNLPETSCMASLKALWWVSMPRCPAPSAVWSGSGCFMGISRSFVPCKCTAGPAGGVPRHCNSALTAHLRKTVSVSFKMACNTCLSSLFLTPKNQSVIKLPFLNRRYGNKRCKRNP